MVSEDNGEDYDRYPYLFLPFQILRKIIQYHPIKFYSRNFHGKTRIRILNWYRSFPSN